MILTWLQRAWLVCLVAVIVGGVMRGEDLAITLLGVLFVLTVALVATPAVLLVIDPRREKRPSAIGSGIANLLSSVWIWLLPDRPLLFTAGAILFAALGALVIARTFTAGPSDPAAPPAPLRHRSSTLLGVLTIFVLVVAYGKTFGGHPHWGHPSAATMSADLRNLISLEDQFFAVHQRYGTLADLAGYEPSLSRATITVAAESTRVVAIASSPETKVQCLVWTGAPPLPTDSAHGAADGVPVCWEL